MSRKVFDTMKKRKYVCANEHELVEIRWGKDPLPTCSECSQPMEETWLHSVNLAPMVNTDDIPGGLEIRHAICNPDGTPKKYYSKSEIRRAAAEAGWTIHGETPNVNSRVFDERARDAERKGRNFV